MKNWDGEVRRVEFEFYLRTGSRVAAKGMKFNPRKSENESIVSLLTAIRGTAFPALISTTAGAGAGHCRTANRAGNDHHCAGNTPVDVGYAVARDLITQLIFLLRSTVVPRVRSWKIRNLA